MEAAAHLGAVVQLRDSLISAVLGPIAAFLFAVALLVFIWGVVQFLFGLYSESEKRKQGKWHMLMGLLGMFIMLAAYAIVALVGNTLCPGAFSGFGCPIR